MHCKQIAKQTKGEITEIELDGLRCKMADNCRRKGICALSPFAFPGLVKGQKETYEEIEPAGDQDDLAGYYEVLRFKNSLGFQWVRAESFSDAVLLAEKHSEKGQPKYIRRVEILQLPD